MDPIKRIGTAIAEIQKAAKELKATHPSIYMGAFDQNDVLSMDAIRTMSDLRFQCRQLKTAKNAIKKLTDSEMDALSIIGPRSRF